MLFNVMYIETFKSNEFLEELQVHLTNVEQDTDKILREEDEIEKEKKLFPLCDLNVF